MVEEIEDLGFERDDLNNESKFYHKGYKRHWTMNYKLLKREPFLEFADTINLSRVPGNKLFFTPRSDNSGDREKAIFKKSNIMILIHKGRTKAPGHRDVEIKLKSVTKFMSLPISDPNLVQRMSHTVGEYF